MNVNSPERKPHKKISHGEAIHRRWELAKVRRNKVFDVDEKIIERSRAQERLADIDRFLSSDDMTLALMNSTEREQTRVGLEIERVWLQNKFEIITKADRQKFVSDLLTKLEQSNPGVYKWLTFRNGTERTMLEKIRDKVMPPIRVEKYYTKR